MSTPLSLDPSHAERLHVACICIYRLITFFGSKPQWRKCGRRRSTEQITQYSGIPFCGYLIDWFMHQSRIYVKLKCNSIFIISKSTQRCNTNTWSPTHRSRWFFSVCVCEHRLYNRVALFAVSTPWQTGTILPHSCFLLPRWRQWNMRSAFWDGQRIPSVVPPMCSMRDQSFLSTWQ